MSFRSIFLLSPAFLASFGAAQAKPITYTETFTASVALNYTLSYYVPVTITATGDTNNILLQGALYVNPLTSVTVQIGSGPVDTVLDPLYAAQHLGYGEFDIDKQSDGIFGIFGLPAALANYDLSAPISTQGTYYLLTSSVNTSAGAFSVICNHYDTSRPDMVTCADPPIPATLNVTTPGSTSPVPEPSSLVLLGSGLLGMTGVARRRFA